MLYSPMEQFLILPFFNFFSNWHGLSFFYTNQGIILTLISIIWFILLKGVGHSNTDSSFFFYLSFDKQINDSYIKRNELKALVTEKFEKVVEYVRFYQIFLELLYLGVFTILKSNVKSRRGAKFFPLIFFLFFTILSLNLIGLIPYSFTLTSHIIITLSISLTIFIGIVLVGIKKHGINFLLLFKPSGISFELAFLLIPIEFISFLVKPISLAIRLFANMMAGHTLLKVIAGFAFTLTSQSGLIFFCHILPFIVLFPLYGLEFAVAVIQSFVFTTLISIYINESLELH